MNEIDLALCRSALYEALALGFRRPTQKTVTRLISEAQNLALRSMASAIDVEAKDHRAGSLAGLVFKLRHCADAQDLEALESSYRFFFGHTAQSKAPLHETEYGEESLFQQPQQLGDIAGFFSAFGLKLNVSEHERVDHISCECEFLAFLTRKEAYALEENKAAMLDETRRAQWLFLRDHLGRFAPALSKLLSREDAEGFYGALGNLCYDFVRSECDRYQVPFGPEFLRLRPSMQMDECFTCGSGEELIQILRPSAAPPNT